MRTRCGRGRVLLLSLKPRYADAILSGAKTIELRRTRPNIKVPALALIYSTSPVRSLVGSCCVESIDSRDTSRALVPGIRSSWDLEAGVLRVLHWSNRGWSRYT